MTDPTMETRADGGAGSPLDVMLNHGFSVGPLNGKIPLTKHGVQDFTRDASVIASWARQFPGCNWGVTQTGVIALDVDPRNGGRVKALRLRPEHRTLCVQTGSGGWHFYYRVSGPVMGKVRGIDGIDVKAGGAGYLVAPGSIHPDTGKPYTLHRDSAIADVPQHIWALIARRTYTPPSAPVRASGDRWDGLVRTVSEATEGNRNGTLFWAAARAAADSAPAAVYSALAAAAHGIGLGAHEIQQTIRSAQQKGA
ncbi:bifunctional DNA primase/polymerase [Mycolicibacterium sp. lyk4-40-TYG-92]|uniref:bifunctional DNA primase/polymerase n=1 Tax=Mycolicibacterium sp. lyk4-40-TYG-92 TaxID=3040295 RepID=UPI00254AF0B5|nr:bifunctional DNA primase/polymerase [Mycolicibacterium sp. lyk4-40-TYG-92]